MSDPAAMDRAQPTWTRLYYAPLVFSRNKNGPTKWWSSSMGITSSYIITDTQVSISLIHDGETEPRTAAAHPLEFEDRYCYGRPFTRDDHDSICHHLCGPEGLWNDLCEDFLTTCREGTLTLVARPYYPLEKLSIIAPDAFEHFEIENCRTGVAKASGGERMYSMHAYRPDISAPEPLPLAPKPPPKRAAPSRNHAEMIIRLKFPSGAPSPAELPDTRFVKTIADASKEYCDKAGIPRIDCSRESILRAAGRK
jgi:hypothetical protein